MTKTDEEPIDHLCFHCNYRESEHVTVTKHQKDVSISNQFVKLCPNTIYRPILVTKK